MRPILGLLGAAALGIAALLGLLAYAVWQAQVVVERRHRAKHFGELANHVEQRQTK